MQIWQACTISCQKWRVLRRHTGLQGAHQGRNKRKSYKPDHGTVYYQGTCSGGRQRDTGLLQF